LIDELHHELQQEEEHQRGERKNKGAHQRSEEVAGEQRRREAEGEAHTENIPFCAFFSNPRDPEYLAIEAGVLYLLFTECPSGLSPAMVLEEE
jgi:hypothetical protein